MINYIITDNVAHDICKVLNKDLDDYEICELVDVIIDEWLYSRD